MELKRGGAVRVEVLEGNLIMVRLPKVGTVEDIRLWYHEVERLLEAAPGPVGMLHDLSATSIASVTAAHRQAVAEGTKRMRSASYASKIVADGRIFDNAIMAGAVRAVTWLTGDLPWAQAEFTREADAKAWVREQMAKRGRGR